MHVPLGDCKKRLLHNKDKDIKYYSTECAASDWLEFQINHHTQKSFYTKRRKISAFCHFK